MSRLQAGEGWESKRLRAAWRPEGRDLGDEVQQVDEGVAGVRSRTCLRRARLERCGHPPRGLGELSHHAATRRGDTTQTPLTWAPGGRSTSGLLRRGAHGVKVERSAGPEARRGEDLVGELLEVGQRAGTRALRRVQGLPDLVATLRADDHVGHYQQYIPTRYPLGSSATRDFHGGRRGPSTRSGGAGAG